MTLKLGQALIWRLVRLPSASSTRGTQTDTVVEVLCARCGRAQESA